MANYDGFKEILLVLMAVSYLAMSDSDCEYKPTHKMCRYKPLACKGGALLDLGITSEDVNDVLDTHNSLRNKVALGKEPGQPSASNMLELSWDNELGIIAQRWAEQCVLGHDKGHNLKVGGYVGQNVAYWIASDDSLKKNFTQVIEYWYNEVVDPGFDPQFIKPYIYNDGYAHYTQVVWAETAYVGCGYSNFSTVSRKGGMEYKKLYVCNYAPGGNMKRGTMYIVGDPATNCPDERSEYYDGLCMVEGW